MIYVFGPNPYYTDSEKQDLLDEALRRGYIKQEFNGQDYTYILTTWGQARWMREYMYENQ